VLKSFCLPYKGKAVWKINSNKRCCCNNKQQLKQEVEGTKNAFKSFFCCLLSSQKQFLPAGIEQPTQFNAAHKHSILVMCSKGLFRCHEAPRSKKKRNGI